MAAKTARKQSATPAPRVVEKTSVPDFDRVIHEKTRLAIVTALAVNDKLSFNELKEIVQTSDGNISVHARKLEEASYIVTKKSFAGRLPRPHPARRHRHRVYRPADGGGDPRGLRRPRPSLRGRARPACARTR